MSCFDQELCSRLKSILFFKQEYILTTLLETSRLDLQQTTQDQLNNLTTRLENNGLIKGNGPWKNLSLDWLMKIFPHSLSTS